MQNTVIYRGMVFPSRIAAAVGKLRYVKEKGPSGFVGCSALESVRRGKAAYWPARTIEELMEVSVCMQYDIHVFDFSQDKIVAGFYFGVVSQEELDRE